MFFAKDVRNESIEIYVSFLSDIIEKDNQNFKGLFDVIINNVHSLAVGSKTYNEINPEIFDIVSLLNFYHSAYFKEIDTQAEFDYNQIKKFLEKDAVMNA